jgi:hypothetical protein
MMIKSNFLFTKIVGILVIALLSFVSNEIRFDNLASKYFDDDTLGVAPSLAEEPTTNQATTIGRELPRRNTTQHSSSSLQSHHDRHRQHRRRSFNQSRSYYYNNTSPILQRMYEAGSSLELSRIQQASFEKKRRLLKTIMPRARRYQAYLSDWGANIVNEDYAYIHIFKNGGTTIAAQTRRNHTKIQSVQVHQRNWFTLVRDPIEHFLSGWAECGYRSRQRLMRSKELYKEYDARVQKWLIRVQMVARRTNKMTCEVHSMPQVNMFLNNRGAVPENLEIVGDLKELPAILGLVGFDYKPKVETGRNATENEFKQMHFPRRVDLLSSTTIRRLCDFLAIDYFLLDYPLPAPCADMPETGYSVWPNPPNMGQRMPMGGEDVAMDPLNPKFQAFQKAALQRKIYRRIADKKILPSYAINKKEEAMW